MPKSEIRESGLAMLRSLARDHARLHALLESFQCWLMRSSAIPFVNDEYPLPREPLVDMLKALLRGSVENNDVVLAAWCASHPFMNIGHKQSVTWRRGWRALRCRHDRSRVAGLAAEH